MKYLFLSVFAFVAIATTTCQAQTSQDNSTDNQTVESILARRSIRKYKPTAVPREAIDVIAKAAINAPSAVNRQPWQVRIVTNAALLSEIGEAYKKENPRAAEQSGFVHPFFNAPAVVFIAIAKGSDAGVQFDCGLLTENICLAAQSLGLGTCIMGHPIGFMKSAAAAPSVQKLGLPEDHELLMSIALGYPNEAPSARPRDAGKLKIIE